MTATPDYLQEFDDDITTSASLPFCQTQNPPNLSLSQIEQFDAPWGWFISSEQAELAKFTPPDHFEPVRLAFGEETKQKREVDGFLATRVRISIIHRSAGIEVQEKTKTGWKYIGQAYLNGQLSEVGELTFSDRENYRLRTRYLVLFLDNQNQPLQQIPFRLGMGRGTGGSFGEEVKEFRSEIERVFFKLRGEPQKSLSDRAHALTALDMKLGLHKGEGKAPFVCAERQASAIDEVGVEKIHERRDRQVKLTRVPIQSLLIPKSHPTGKLILSIWEEHQDFPTKFQDDLANGNGSSSPISNEPHERESADSLEEGEFVF